MPPGMYSVAIRANLSLPRPTSNHPRERIHLDWAHFGNSLSRRLYLFALTLAYS